MPETRTFFVPNADPLKQEAAYAELARWSGRSVSDARERIAITFVHDGEEWTATVGEQLRGHTVADPRARAKKRRIAQPVNDEATVLAIFSGDP